MTLLLDTHVLVWVAADSSKLSRTVRDALISPDAQLYVSAINAYEYIWLWQTRRIDRTATFSALIDRLDCTVLDYPAEAWPLVERLPPIHGDPIDRMMIAHAMASDLTLVSCDTDVSEYPVRRLW